MREGLNADLSKVLRRLQCGLATVQHQRVTKNVAGQNGLATALLESSALIPLEPPLFPAC